MRRLSPLFEATAQSLCLGPNADDVCEEPGPNIWLEHIQSQSLGIHSSVLEEQSITENMLYAKATEAKKSSCAVHLCCFYFC